MSNLIDTSFFIGEIAIPNTGSAEIQEYLQIFIYKYEERCLQGILGYSLYKEFVANPTDQRMLDLINGKEYLFGSILKNWKGLVYNSLGLPMTQTVIGYSQLASQQVQAGTTPGFDFDVNTFTFDGTFGKPDWRGQSFVLDRSEFGTMIKDLDYSFDIITGQLILLAQDDIFAEGQWLTVQFDPIPILGYVVATLGVSFSLIAYYIYYMIMHDKAIWNSGIGTVIPKGDTVISNPPTFKMNWAYNEFARQGRSLCSFLKNNVETYPEWDGSVQCNAIDFTKTINDFSI